MQNVVISPIVTRAPGLNGSIHPSHVLVGAVVSAITDEPMCCCHDKHNDSNPKKQSFLQAAPRPTGKNDIFSVSATVTVG